MNTSGMITVGSDAELREQMEEMASEVSRRLHGEDAPAVGGRVVLVIPFDIDKPESACGAHQALLGKALPAFLASLEDNNLELLDIDEWNVHSAGGNHGTAQPVVTMELRVQRKGAEAYSHQVIIPNAERIIGEIRHRAQEESAAATKQ